MTKKKKKKKRMKNKLKKINKQIKVCPIEKCKCGNANINEKKNTNTTQGLKT